MYNGEMLLAILINYLQLKIETHHIGNNSMDSCMIISPGIYSLIKPYIIMYTI